MASLPQRLAARLGDHLKAGALGTRFRARDVYLKGWADLDDRESAESALRVLEDAGWVWKEEGKSGPNGGRPFATYFVHAEVYRE